MDDDPDGPFKGEVGTVRHSISFDEATDLYTWKTFDLTTDPNTLVSQTLHDDFELSVAIGKLQSARKHRADFLKNRTNGKVIPIKKDGGEDGEH